MIEPGRALRGVLSLLALLAGLYSPSACQATLVGPGDLTFVRFNGDGFDDFAIVLLADADAGQLVSFNTGVYLHDLPIPKFGAGSHMVWEVTESLAAGTVVTFIDLDRFRLPTVSEGLIQNPDNNMLPLFESGTQINAYLGTDNLFPGTFLGGITSLATTTFSGTGLTLGDTAIYLPPTGGDVSEEGHYVGPRDTEMNFADYRSLIANVNANWTRRGNTAPPGFPAFDSSHFTLEAGASVPESPTVVFIGTLVLLSCLSVATRLRRPAVAVSQ